MLNLVQFVGNLTSISRLRTESTVFKLHYAFTVPVLLAFSIIVTTKQFAGAPITCIKPVSVDQKILNTFCWIHATYTIPSATDEVGKDVPHPGIRPTKDKSKMRYHKYYQWVFFVLFIQALFFYAPRWLWKTWEAGKVSTLTENLYVAIADSGQSQDMEKLLINYLLTSWGTHNCYAAKYLFCEAFAFVNVVTQLFILDAFFKGSFLTFGIDVVHFLRTSKKEHLDPRLRLFPHVTKCNFLRYGSSATLESIDALCVMALNVINDKIYIFLWFWFIVLSILSGLSLLMFLVTFIFPTARYYALYILYQGIDPDSVRYLAWRGSFGDFFLIYLIGFNVDIIVFECIVPELAVRLKKESKEKV